jgi:TPR repeat protein
VEHRRARSSEIAALYQRAQQKDADAEYKLGLRLLRGEGLPRNEADAVAWFERAATIQHARAQFQLGMAYISGGGVAQDPVLGYTWITLASANGDTEADSAIRELTPKLTRSEIARVRWNIAEMYRKGIGVAMDKPNAYRWYVLAEAAGEDRSVSAKNELASTMTAEQVASANAAALSWLKKHQM